MGRHAYPLSPEALAEIRRLVDTGKRRHAIAGAPRSPSYRDIAERLYRAQLTKALLDPKVLWRACKANGIELPARAPSLGLHRRPPKWLKGTARCRVGKAQPRGVQT